jgi:hypothetical protein
MRPVLDTTRIFGCVEQLMGAPPVRELFRIVHLSSVHGIELRDGRLLVVKVRPTAERVAGCEAVHRHLWQRGLPCAQPLAGPVPLGDHCLTVEAMIEDGPPLEPAAQHPSQSAQALAGLVSMAPPVTAVPTLDPPPPWVHWAHDEGDIWPWPDDLDADLNAHPGPEWLDDLGRRVRARLAGYQAPAVVGHGDWEAQNVVWKGGRLHAVHDWDSVVSLPEATIAGAAATVFAVRGCPPGAPGIEQTEAFLDAYARARDLVWSRDDREAGWAAGLWVRAFNAKKASLDPHAGQVVPEFQDEATERLRRAGG